MSFRDVLLQVIRALDHVAIPYMITGSVASSHVGLNRSTNDVDIVIEANTHRLQALENAIPTSEFYFDSLGALDGLKRTSMFNAIHLPTSIKFDFIFRKPGAYSE